MAASFQSAYIYSRLCGSFARSYIGERASALSRVGRVGEIWKQLFDEAPPALPETVLVAAAERKLVERSYESIRRIAGATAVEEPAFLALLRKNDFALAKRVFIAAREGSPAPRELEERGRSTDVDPSGYPELGKVFGRGRFSWLAGAEDLVAAKNRLDRQYYAELWEALRPVPEALLGPIRGLLLREAELENLVWALRLRRYYAMKPEQIEGFLIKLKGANPAKAARAALGFRSNARGDWNGWKWERFVNEPEKTGEDWFLDVRGFEAAVRRHLFVMLRRGLHRDPFTYGPLYCAFRLREFESAAVFGVIEGVHLEVPAEEIAAFALEAAGGRP
jgi:hypothetical protein